MLIISLEMKEKLVDKEGYKMSRFLAVYWKWYIYFLFIDIV